MPTGSAAGAISMLHKQMGDNSRPTYPVLVDWLSSMDVAKTTMRDGAAEAVLRLVTLEVHHGWMGRRIT
jgi:hypothetical protein